MSQLLLPILVGFLLLGVLLYWFLNGAAADEHPPDLSQARKTLDTLRFEFPPTGLVDRIFDPRDLAFARLEEDPNALRLLESERKRIAIHWLRRIRQQVVVLMRTYRQCVRGNVHLKARSELGLAFAYWSFLTHCWFFLALIRLRGPFRTRETAAGLASRMTQFCEIFEKLLARPTVGEKGIPAVAGDNSAGRRGLGS